MEIIGRSEARALGLKRYYSGVPCVKGHLTERLVSNGTCIRCLRLRDSERQKNMPLEKINARNNKWRNKNLDRIANTRRAWRAANPEKDKAYAEKYRRNHRDVVSASNKKQYEKDIAASRARNNRLYRERPEVFRAASKRWRKEHQAEARQLSQARRTREYGATGRYTQKDIEEIFFSQGGRCLGCRADFTEVPYTIDHQIPLSRGGSNDPDNLALLCQPCNSSKNTRTMVEWLEWRAGLSAI